MFALNILGISALFVLTMECELWNGIVGDLLLHEASKTAHLTTTKILCVKLILYPTEVFQNLLEILLV